MSIIDVHTHMYTRTWLELLRTRGGLYGLKVRPDGREEIFRGHTPVALPMPGHFDYELRLRDMDAAGIDLAIVSLTCPNVFWGGPEISLQAARIMNDDMREAQTAHPSRLRWFASLPWQYPELALPERERACAAGASGVMVLANIGGVPLTDPQFASIWAAIDAKGLPVLVHPTAPPGVAEMDMSRFQLTASIGFTFDTTLALARMIYDGFFDRYRKLKIIGGHGGGALPYLIARMDQCFDNIPACREKTDIRPQEYMSRIYCDSVLFSSQALALCVDVFGADNVLYGSDYPHTIGDMPGCLARVNALPAVVREKVRGLNARTVFAL